MIELLDTLPDINVQPAEYKRLLGFPREYVVAGHVRELSEWARTWYAQNARPWIYAREAQSLKVTESEIIIDGVPFTSKALHKTLSNADADGAVVVAVSAGRQAEEEAQRLWKLEKPDEYFFLEIFASAVVEHLTTSTGARLCAWAEARNLAVLPHYSPGYPDWDISQQGRLLELVRQTKQYPLPDHLEALQSGMLRPKKSLIAVFGLTRHVERVRKLTDLVPCENCSFGSCQYRRVPYRRASEFAPLESTTSTAGDGAIEAPAPPLKAPLEANAKYSVNAKALKRWADERLTLTSNSDGSFDALFRYEGTTCTNMGRAILFHYHVKISPREQGYLILDQKCGPAPGDTGHTYMCRYMNNAEHLMVAIDQEKPLLGQKLNDVLTWTRNVSNAGCYCEPNSRKHKWGLVLETIHFALLERERPTSKASAIVV
ncbi:MAG TPA: hypothetical protein VF669_09740 [Tepidisphaeraceae bacterium]|jgi:hypothetical protein